MNKFSLKQRAIGLSVFLICTNVLAWVWVLIIFHNHPVMLSATLLSYSFGFRHAVDADHIAAIDTVTRKLMQHGIKSLGVGAFFSLGHSTIVILACLAIVVTSKTFGERIGFLHQYGGMIGTAVSAFSLLVMAVLNLVILLNVCRQFRKAIKEHTSSESLNLETSAVGGVSFQIFQHIFKLVNRSWHMYLVGFLFGLGFDTATEVGLLSISASAATNELSLWSLMVFPVLFTVAMALIDSLDNFVMVGVYGWTFSNPLRKLYYNITITAASVIVALAIGGLEALGLIVERFQLKGCFWDFIAIPGDHMTNAGFWVVGVFVLLWIVSFVNYRWRGYDKLSVTN